jgi:hypothetical protein
MKNSVKTQKIQIKNKVNIPKENRDLRDEGKLKIKPVS